MVFTNIVILKYVIREIMASIKRKKSFLFNYFSNRKISPTDPSDSKKQVDASQAAIPQLNVIYDDD